MRADSHAVSGFFVDSAKRREAASVLLCATTAPLSMTGARPMGRIHSENNADKRRCKCDGRHRASASDAEWEIELRQPGATFSMVAID